MVRKVAVPARSSFVKQLFLASNLKYFPMKLFETASFRPFCMLLHDFAILLHNPPPSLAHSSPPISLSLSLCGSMHVGDCTYNIYALEKGILYVRSFSFIFNKICLPIKEIQKCWRLINKECTLFSRLLYYCHTI